MEKLKELNKNIILRMISIFIMFLMVGMIVSNMIFYYQQNFGTKMAGIISIIIQIIAFISVLYSGFLSDRFGRKPIIKIGVFLQIIAYTGVTICNSPIVFNPYLTTLLFFIYSVGMCFTITSLQATLFESATATQRRYVYTLDNWIQLTAFLIGSLIGSLLFKNYFFQSLLIADCLVAISAYINLFLIQETNHNVKREQHQQTNFFSVFKSYHHVLADRRYIIFILGAICLATVEFQYATTLPTHLATSFSTVTVLGMKINYVLANSILIGINSLTVVFLMGAISRLSAKYFRDSTSCLIADLLEVFGFGCCLVATNIYFLLLARLLASLGDALNVAPSENLRTAMIDPEHVGVYAGLNQAGANFGACIASLMIILSTYVGQWGLVIVLVALGMIRAVTVLISAKMKSTFAIKDYEINQQETNQSENENKITTI